MADLVGDDLVARNLVARVSKVPAQLRYAVTSAVYELEICSRQQPCRLPGAAPKRGSRLDLDSDEGISYVFRTGRAAPPIRVELDWSASAEISLARQAASLATGVERIDCDLAFQSRQRCTQTEVCALSKGDVTVFLPGNVQAVGMIKLGFITFG